MLEVLLSFEYYQNIHNALSFILNRSNPANLRDYKSNVLIFHSNLFVHIQVMYVLQIFFKFLFQPSTQKKQVTNSVEFFYLVTSELGYLSSNLVFFNLIEYAFHVVPQKFCKYPYIYILKMYETHRWKSIVIRFYIVYSFTMLKLFTLLQG